LNSAAALRNAGRLEEADRVLAEAVEAHPEAKGALSDWIDCATRRRDWPELARRCDIMRERFPGDSRGYAWGGRALLELERPADAEELLAAGMRQFPDDREILFHRALSAHRRRDWVEAAARSRQMLEKFPDVALSYIFTGRALLEMGDYTAAEPLLAEAVRRSPNDPGVFASWASRPERQEDWAEAARRWAEMRARFPESPTGYIRGSQTLLRADRQQEAETLLADALRQFPGRKDLDDALRDVKRQREEARLGQIAASALRASAARAITPPKPLKYVFRGHEQAGFFAHALTLGGNHELIAPAAGNQPPSDEQYICLVPVLDFWRMDRYHAEKEQVGHYCTALEDQITQHLRSRRALLVFDLCNEGPEFDREIFRQLLEYLDTKAVPASQVVWLAQNRAIAKCYIEAFGATRREHIRFDYYDFFIKSMAWTFGAHSGELYRPNPGVFARQMFDESRKDKLLLCLNATPRLHRVLTVAELIYRNWTNASLVSFPGLSYAKPGHTREDIVEFVKRTPGLGYLKTALQRAMAIQNLRVDAFEETGNALFDKIDPNPYLRTFFSLVTETENTDGAVDRITEKAIKPFCFGHPALVVGNPNATAFLKEFGFEDWSGAIDREYESERDPGKRFRLLFDEVERQISAIRCDPHAWLGSVREVGEANIDYAASGRFLATYVERYDRAITTRLREALTQNEPAVTGPETAWGSNRTMPPSHEFKSQWGQDKFIFEHLMDFPNGTFLEVGALDGISLSNTYFFEKTLGWHGILIEMMPWVFPEITKQRPGSRCFNCALSPGTMKQLFLDAGDRSGLLRYLDKREIQYLEDHYRGIEPKPIFNLHWIETRPLMDIIMEAKLSCINYFSLDVEGAEIAILELIDFEKVQIDLFSIEDNAAENQWRAYDEFLRPHGYTCIGGLGVDGFFVHERLRERLLKEYGSAYLGKISQHLRPFGS
jgi:tetratricopeptide (TPR) repeat protein